jgi:thiosulfate dehydrogenase [quinone] large subunit
MNTTQNFALFFLRISLGWLFFYAGITKVLDSTWSAAGYISSAKTFPELFDFFLTPTVLPIVNLANEWGLTLIGVALILGVFTRLAAGLGILLMILYYLVVLDFPYPNAHAYIVDEHIIYIGALLVLAIFNAGRAWGLGNKVG